MSQWTLVGALGCAMLLSACPVCPDGQTCGVTVPPTPRAVLTITEPSPIIGPKVVGSVTGSGCKTIQQLRVLVNDVFVAETSDMGKGSAFEVPLGLLLRFFPEKGIAASLVFTGEVQCDDGRKGTSLPVSVTYFPAEKVTSAGSAPALPDTFIAEGGFGTRPTTFIGCSGGTASSLVRVDQDGFVIAKNDALPFACDYQATFTEKSTQAPRTIRWLQQPGEGALAFISNPGQSDDLRVTNFYAGKLTYVSLAKDDPAADAVMIEETSQEPFLHRLTGINPTSMGTPYWTVKILGGIPNAPPVVSVARGELHLSMWNFDQTRVGQVRYYRYRYADGAVLNGVNGTKIWQLTFNALNTPITPYGAFSEDGAIYYVPLLTATTGGDVVTYVVACATASEDCDRGVRRWTSPPLAGQISVVVQRPGALAAAGPLGTYFLDTNDGKFKYLRSDPIRPSGSLLVQTLVEGLSTDFYMLHGPNLGEGNASYPTEVVALDEMGRPEIWRLGFGTGAQPQSALWVAADEGGLPWLRVGLNQVKPLRNSVYCGFLLHSECKP